MLDITLQRVYDFVNYHFHPQIQFTPSYFTFTQLETYNASFIVFYLNPAV